MKKSEAASVLKVDRSTVTRMCQSGELKTIKGKGKCDEVDPVSVENKRRELLGEKLDKEVKEQKDANAKAVSEAELENLIFSLHLSAEQGERLKATLTGFSKSKAETILKTEQALAKQEENLLRRGNFVEVEKLSDDLEKIFELEARCIRDLIAVWAKRNNLSPSEADKMRLEYDSAIKKSFTETKELFSAKV